MSGWKVEKGNHPGVQRCVMVAAPHTSNWDFVIARAAFEVMEIPVRFTIKKEWMDGFLGGLLKALGAIGIDRKPKSAQEKPISYVDAMVKLFEQQKELAVLITPEGTRSKNDQWRTGFYHVARLAKVPIALGFLDYSRKVAGVGLVFEPGDDMQADMERIMNFYRDIHPAFPEKFALDSRYS